MSKEEKLENGGPSDANPADEKAEQAATTTETPAVENTEGMKWYVVHTYSGYEQKAKLALAERIRQFKMEAVFGEILVNKVIVSGKVFKV